MSKRIYTRKGDKGKTGLLSGGRIEKIDPRVEAYGTVDELISTLGVAKAYASSMIGEHIHSIQQVLFYVAAELATDRDSPGYDESELGTLRRVGAGDVMDIEHLADALSEVLPPISNFIIPGGSPGAAFLHQARTVCRRAERRVIAFSKLHAVNPEITKYLNRLSDLFFVMARYSNLQNGDGDDLISREGVTKQTRDSQ
ncbi:MAG: cob(I)yrinic acid a,c-diamide adenosyltransferase [Candidatus Thorarchaeota archaeon]